MKVEPSQPRFRWEDHLGRLRVTLPARRNWLVLIFLSAWLVGWVFGEVMVPTQLFGRTGKTGVDLFAAAWLVMWTIGGGFAIYIWLWNLVGREAIDVDSLGALAVVLVFLAYHGPAPQPDEGAAAHIWQLLMAGQVPVASFFAIKWIPKRPRDAGLILVLQLGFALAAMVPVFLLHW